MQLLLVFILVLIAIDSLWLFGASKMHQSMAQAVQGKPLQAKLGWAAGFYALGALAFSQVILPMGKGDLTKTAQYGALMGLLMYGTFDMTNKAIFTNYPTDYAIYDTAWGTFAIAAASVITLYLGKKYGF